MAKAKETTAESTSAASAPDAPVAAPATPATVDAPNLLAVDITDLATQINATLDLPWVPESVEQKWIEWVLARVVKVVPEKIVVFLTNAADGLSLEELTLAEDEIVKLANKLIDIPMIPEGVEEGFIRPVVRQLLTFAQTGKSLTLAK